MLVLMVNFVHQMVRKLYKLQQIELFNGRFRHTPHQQWRNDYPIVLVHGYMGYGPDQAPMLGNYF